MPYGRKTLAVAAAKPPRKC